MDPEPDGTTSRPDLPAWLYVFAGWLLASTQIAPQRESLTEREMTSRAPFRALDPPEDDPDRMSPRELRRLPAIGPTRALAITRARWEQGLVGGPESWQAIPGIGPETVHAIRGALQRPTEGP